MAKSIIDRWSIKSTYDRLKNLPLGLATFSRFVGFVAPYTGTISPRVEKLENGFARVSMSDRRIVRNHLNSVHAIALMNLGEVTTGLAIHYGMPSSSRAILTELSMQYLKKARGTLHAEAHSPVPEVSQESEHVVTAQIYDESKTVVAIATAKWLVRSKS